MSDCLYKLSYFPRIFRHMLVRLCCLAIVAYCTIALPEWCTATMAWLDYMSSGITTCSEGDKLLTWSDWFTPSYTFTIALKCICLQWRISLQCDKLSDGLGSRFLNYNIHRMIDKPIMYTQHKLLCSTQCVDKHVNHYFHVLKMVFSSLRLLCLPRFAGWSPFCIWAPSWSSIICCDSYTNKKECCAKSLVPMQL